jgi:2-amino-4-hydroxy-6-hydroxymethyldihydropteridine diphosphokinase
MILIALGSNLGDRADYLAQARVALEGHDIEISSASSIIETPALVPEGAPGEWNVPYLNQVVRVRTALNPMALLMCLKLIEHDLGRQERATWAPREIDLDLLAYGDEIILTERLVLPHPQMDNRAFVLKPLAEIAPHWRHPVLEKTAAELLAELPR